MQIFDQVKRFPRENQKESESLFALYNDRLGKSMIKRVPLDPS